LLRLISQCEDLAMQAASVCSGFKVRASSKGIHFAPQPNGAFNADANIGHGFAIFMANVGALRPYRASGAG
jgi:hypothetical protein